MISIYLESKDERMMMKEQYLDEVFTTRRNDNGLFITIAGFDGSGKTTQIKALEKYFKERECDVLITAEPTQWYREQIEVRNFLEKGGDYFDAKRLALLIAADRFKHLQETIIPALEEGKVIICDRYVQVTFALMLARGVEPKLIIETNKGIIRPNISFYLNVDAKTLIERLHFRDGENLKYEERKIERIENIIQHYKKMGKYLINIDGKQAVNDVTKDIINILEKNVR